MQSGQSFVIITLNTYSSDKVLYLAFTLALANGQVADIYKWSASNCNASPQYLARTSQASVEHFLAPGSLAKANRAILCNEKQPRTNTIKG
eukprot:scaffold623477_cov43-Prasinocladus_malaysianus.AAC.1